MKLKNGFFFNNMGSPKFSFGLTLMALKVMLKVIFQTVISQKRIYISRAYVVLNTNKKSILFIDHPNSLAYGGDNLI